MPLIMDNTDLGDTSMGDGQIPGVTMMDSMDDLFGETANDLSVHAPMVQSLPPTSELVRRIADMQNSGCCTKLAWSNTGSVARISSDGSEITFHFFLEDPSTGERNMSSGSPYPLTAPAGNRWMHLEFSISGQDLAVIDDLGVVHFFVCATGLGRMNSVPTEVGQDSRSELNAIVGLHWLPQWPIDFRAPYVGPSNKVNSNWMQKVNQRDPQTPRTHHPADGKHAVVYVSRNGTLSLSYQQEGGRWYAISKELDRITTLKELLTHVAFCQHGDQLLLVTHDLSKHLRVYTINISWNATQQPRPYGPPMIRVAPSLQVSHTTSLESATPQHSEGASLTTLHIIPPVALFTEPSIISHATILATYSQAGLPTNSTQQHECFTTICRWHLEDVVQALHPSFAKLRKQANSSIALPSTKLLRRQADLGTGKLLLSFQLLNHETIVAFGCSDGTVEFRDRGTWNLIEPFGDTNTVTSLAQAGFEYNAGEHSIHIALNSNCAAMAFVKPDDGLKFKSMILRYGWHPLEDGILDTEGVVEAAVACLAREHTILIHHNASTIELLPLLPADLSPELQQLFRREITRSITRSYDLRDFDDSNKQKIIIREQNLPRALSAQLALSLLVSPQRTSPPLHAQLAWAVLSVRHAHFAIISSTGRADVPLPAVIHSLRGVARWSLDVFTSILTALTTAKRLTDNGSLPAEAINTYITENNSPALHLLFCCYPRTLLRFLGIYLPRYFKLLAATLPRSRSLLEKQQLLETLELAKQIPYRFETIGAPNGLLAEIDKAINDSYTQAELAAGPRGEIELDMLTSCTISDTLHPAIESILTKLLPRHLPELDLSKLYFADTTWLQLHAVDSVSAKRFDALRKTPLPEKARLRLCRRCGSAMEDLVTSLEGLRELPPWLSAVQRSCVCMCAWTLPFVT